jgi:diacylglycerol O-acyltransferase
MSKERLSSIDKVLLRTESPANPMMVTGAMVFGDPLAFERLRETIEVRFLRYARFRQRVVQPALPWRMPYWELDPGFDLDYHLQRAVLPAPGNQAALQDLVSFLASTQLDLTKPLWQLHYIERYRGGSALICRLHHCMADGVSLVQVLLSLADAGSPRPENAQPQLENAQHKPGRLRALAGRARARYVGRRRAARKLVRGGLSLLSHPARAVDLMRMGTRAATTLGNLALMPPDPTTTFRGKMDVSKRAVWSATVPLDEVKAIGRRMGGTVNDILLTAMTGALQAYLQGQGEWQDGITLRAAVPVNMRPPGTGVELGNRIGMVFLALPVGLADPAERLRELKRRMDELKGSLEPPLTYSLLHAIGAVPAPIQNVLIDFLGTKASALMTNVTGPREPIYLAGAPLESLMFWVPQSGGVGLGVSILSYAGQVRLGVLVDEGLVPDPEEIVAAFHAEFETLLDQAQKLEETYSASDLSAMLDDALVTLDMLVAGGVAPAGTDVANSPARCKARTLAGRRCKNRSLSDTDYCHIHQRLSPTESAGESSV